MDKKTIIAVAGSTAVTLIVTMLIGWVAGVFEAGNKALTEQQIRAVVAEVMITDKGDTYSASLARIDGSLLVLATQMNGVQTDVADIRTAVRALAAE